MKDTVFDAILKGIEDGASLTAMCKKRRVSKRTFYEHIDGVPDLENQYARARARQADHYAEQIIDIADASKDAAKARNRIDARKWYASKVAPRKYGERVSAELSGPNGRPIEHVDLSKLSAEELDAYEALALKLSGATADGAGSTRGDQG